MAVPANQKNIKDFLSNCVIKDTISSKPVYTSSKTRTGKVRYLQWRIFVGLLDKNINRVRITPNNIFKSLPDGYTAYIQTASGFEGSTPTLSGKTYINFGKNIGKRNETTALTQAILEARSRFNKKINRGGALSKTGLIIDGKITMAQLMRIKKIAPWRVFPMALHDVKSNWRHVKYPGVIQPKYDGTRFIVVYHPKLPSITVSGAPLTIDGYSRSRETYKGQEHIFAALAPIIKNYPGLYLDGELWKQGYRLQHISGISRRQTETEIKAAKLDYYIFDCFYTDKPEMPFSERANILKQLGAVMAPCIKFVFGQKYNTKQEAEAYYSNYLEQGLEGGVLRNMDSLYNFGINKERRSYTTLKIKPMDDDEWPVIGFSEGKGKDIGALKWICTVTKETVDNHSKKYNNPSAKFPPAEHRQFVAVPKGELGDYETRYKLFTFLNKHPDYFNKYLKDKLMTIQFTTISDYGKPQQPKAIGFRDKKIMRRLLTDLDV